MVPAGGVDGERTSFARGNEAGDTGGFPFRGLSKASPVSSRWMGAQDGHP